MERLPSTSPWHPYVSVDPDRLGGEPVFRGTRVPVRTLFDYLEGGETVEQFMDDFPGVTREQIAGVLRLAGQAADTGIKAA
jgi:uncharacterized protein (DUF433 family)